MRETGAKDGLCKYLVRTTEKGIFLCAPILLDETLEVNCGGIKVTMITGLIMGQLPGLSLNLILDSKLNHSVENLPLI